MRNKILFERVMNLIQAVRRFEDLTAKFLENNINKRGDRVTVLKDIIWIPSGAGWLMINVDATTKDGKNKVAMVVRNNTGQVLFLTSKVFHNLSLEFAKIIDIDWASSIAMDFDYENVLWISNA